MKKYTQFKGFTLIELLVVVAIIGILSAVVIASLSGARDKAKDASAKASLQSVGAQAEIFYIAGNTYEGVCADEGTDRLVQAADDQVAGAAACTDNAASYVASVALNDGNTFCVDSTGFRGIATASSDAPYRCIVATRNPVSLPPGS